MITEPVLRACSTLTESSGITEQALSSYFGSILVGVLPHLFADDALVIIQQPRPSRKPAFQPDDRSCLSMVTTKHEMTSLILYYLQ
jgi:hypothetical protein